MTSRIRISIVLLLSLSSIIPTGLAIDTGEVGDYLESMEANIPISIHLWGYGSELLGALESLIPDYIVQEAFYPSKPEVAQLQIGFDGTFNGLRNSLDVKILEKNSNDFQEILSTIKTINSDISEAFNPLNISEVYSGRSITKNSLISAFNKHDETNRYNIHIANFTELNTPEENKIHWFNLGSTQIIDSRDQDLRNVMMLKNQSILFDPTGIAPYFGFGIENYLINTSPNSISNAILDIIEEAIIGSPMSYWFTPMEREIHIAKITIGVESSDLEYRILQDSASFSTFKDQVNRLFPGYDVVTSSEDVDLSIDASVLADYLIENTQVIDGENIVIVDQEFAEIFKTEVRQLYSKFPSRYYMGLFMFVDNSRKYMLETEDQGLQPYSVGQIGFSMEHIDDWSELNAFEISEDRITYRLLQLLGKNFGLPLYSRNVTRQIESPMSDYGITSLWDGFLTKFESDSIKRRNAVAMMTQLIRSVGNQISNVENAFLPGYDTNALLEIRNSINSGTLLLEKLNYSGALEVFHQLFDRYETELENVTKARNVINYGSIIFAVIIVLAYYSKILSDDSFSKTEFKRRIEKLRRFNKELEDDTTNFDPLKNTKKPRREE